MVIARVMFIVNSSGATHYAWFTVDGTQTINAWLVGLVATINQLAGSASTIKTISLAQLGVMDPGI